MRIEPLLTQPLSPRLGYGYGDPAVLHVPGPAGSGAGTYYLLVTSNDAPDAFPILRSPDLRHWEEAGCVFPEGHKPAWALDGPGRSDFWAAELHRVEGEYLVVFTARRQCGGELAIGVARSSSPCGPFVPDEQPLVAGGVIDPHVLLTPQGEAYLFWKHDSNDEWPLLLAQLLHDQPRLVADLFPDPDRRRAASLCASLWSRLGTLPPMDRFLALQPLIEAVTSDFASLRQRLQALARTEPGAVARTSCRLLEAMCTPIYAQRLCSGCRSLAGPRHVVLTNDREWEGHLVEGVWVSRHGDKYYLFYAGNDFTTAQYGIGVAVADSPLGPYVKQDTPLLTSTAQWWGPGHPSLAEDPEGCPQLLFHAFHPGCTGYKRFRALLMAPVEFEPAGVALR
ncbi:MAG TPA: family 43 glycosylhydrolase [Ramlibacter sp.]|nr:family 43 glycosylhydrolase [Ramlibacter sp.]